MGIELVKLNKPEEYDMKITNDKFKTNGALYNEKTGEIISSIRGAIEISVEGNEDLRAQVMRIGGMHGYTNESELMTGM
jgi:sulfatase maturation enzyme AslB (radical SAM superfamily)